MVTIGKYTYGFDKVRVWWGEMANISIGKFCSIALDGVEFYCGGKHHNEWITTYPFGHIHQNIFNTVDGSNHPTTKGDISIGNDVWIGNFVKIFSGVTIGDGACIAAYSVITKDVPPYTVFAGNPGQPRKKRFSDEDIEFLLRLKWWDLPEHEINMIVPILSSTDISKLKEIHKV
jgi:acetyltransferase-like isoleucine patch superfamily enzyme